MRPCSSHAVASCLLARLRSAASAQRRRRAASSAATRFAGVNPSPASRHRREFHRTEPLLRHLSSPLNPHRRATGVVEQSRAAVRRPPPEFGRSISPPPSPPGASRHHHEDRDAKPQLLHPFPSRANHRSTAAMTGPVPPSRSPPSTSRSKFGRSRPSLPPVSISLRSPRSPLSVLPLGQPSRRLELRRFETPGPSCVSVYVRAWPEVEDGSFAF